MLHRRSRPSAKPGRSVREAASVTLPVLCNRHHRLLPNPSPASTPCPARLPPVTSNLLPKQTPLLRQPRRDAPCSSQGSRPRSVCGFTPLYALGRLPEPKPPSGWGAGARPKEPLRAPNLQPFPPATPPFLPATLSHHECDRNGITREMTSGGCRACRPLHSCRSQVPPVCTSPRAATCLLKDLRVISRVRRENTVVQVCVRAQIFIPWGQC